jgi:hypothetical protein
MTIDPRLFNHPVIRREAERRAREIHAKARELREAAYYREDALLTLALRGLLSDPSRPETRDALVRLGSGADDRWCLRGGTSASYPYAVYKARRLHVRVRHGVSPQTAVALYRTRWWHSLRDDPDALVQEFLEVTDA